MRNWTIFFQVRVAAGRNFQWQFFALDPCVFFWGYGGYAEATEGPSGVHRLRLHGGNYVEFPYTQATPPFAQQSTQKACSLKKQLQKMDSFLKFRFSKGTNAELKLRSTLQHRAGGVLKLENLTSRKNRNCQRLHRSWRFRDRRIFWWKTPCGQYLWDGTQNERDPPVWPKFMCEQLQLFTEIKYLASRKLWNLQTWKYQTQTLELCHLLASNSNIRIWIAPSIETSLDSNT